MSQPRQIKPETTYLISRRCSERRYLLRPDNPLGAIFLYLLAYAASACGILIHGVVVMPNHYHLCVTDVSGLLPRFLELFNGLLARSLNRYRGRWESFFAPGSYSAVALRNPEDGLRKLTYLLANPVTAGLVSHGRHWTGVSSRGWSFGQTRTFMRPPGGFFGPDCSLPAEASLCLTALPDLGRLPTAEADRLVETQVEAAEAETRARFASEGRRFLGMHNVLRLDPNGAPSSIEPRRTLRPHLAAKDKGDRLEAIDELRQFRRAYREAWLAWRRGDADVVFPPGTWLMRVRYRAPCGTAPE